MTRRIDTQTQVISGAAIGVFRLRTLISALKLEIQGMSRKGTSAYVLLKRELGIKGSREKVLAQAEQCLADVAKWSG